MERGHTDACPGAPIANAPAPAPCDCLNGRLPVASEAGPRSPNGGSRFARTPLYPESQRRRTSRHGTRIHRPNPMIGKNIRVLVGHILRGKTGPEIAEKLDALERIAEG